MMLNERGRFCIVRGLAALALGILWRGAALGFYPDRLGDVAYVPPEVEAVVRPVMRTRWNFNGLLPRMPDEANRGMAYYNKYLPFIATRRHMPWVDRVPPNPQANALRAAVGCVNLVMGQIMHLHRYPNAEALAGSSLGRGRIFRATIKDNRARTFRAYPMALLGGTASGDFYDWAAMPLAPAMADLYHFMDSEDHFVINASGDVLLPEGSPEWRQQDEAARLLADVGAAMGSVYVLDGDADGIMTAGVVREVPAVLREVFRYPNAKFYGPARALVSKGAFERAVIPSLDRGAPVMVDLLGDAEDRGAGHAVLVDGYGYLRGDRSRRLYHVLIGHGAFEPGLGGDGWYELPNERVAGQFSGVKGVVYNIFPDFAGRLIGGRGLVNGALLSGDATVDVWAGAPGRPVLVGKTCLGKFGDFVLPLSFDLVPELGEAGSVRLDFVRSGRLCQSFLIPLTNAPDEPENIWGDFDLSAGVFIAPQGNNAPSPEKQGDEASLYVWEGGDLIVNHESGEPGGKPSGALWIGGEADLAATSLTRSGEDLLATLRDADGRRLGSVTVRGWYGPKGKRLMGINFNEKISMTAEEIDEWTDAERAGGR